MRIVRWNENGIRAAERKGFLDWLHGTQPDIVGLQETKAAPEQLSAEILAPAGYARWTVRVDARERNFGWHIDYAFASPDLAGRTADAAIHKEVAGSDHCPVSVTLRV
jgi:exodeoxyribonuclease III